jgi:hypothetical protein
VILRDAIVRSTAWRASAAAVLTGAQAAPLNALRQAGRLGNSAFPAWNSDLAGSYLASTSRSAFGTGFSFGLPAIYLDVQSYLSLSDAQVCALNNLISAAGQSTTALSFQVKLANANARLELLKDPIDAVAAGNLIPGMDSVAKQADRLVTLRAQLIAVLTDTRKQKRKDLDAAYDLMYVTSSGVWRAWSIRPIRR